MHLCKWAQKELLLSVREVWCQKNSNKRKACLTNLTRTLMLIIALSSLPLLLYFSSWAQKSTEVIIDKYPLKIFLPVKQCLWCNVWKININKRQWNNNYLFHCVLFYFASEILPKNLRWNQKGVDAARHAALRKGSGSVMSLDSRESKVNDEMWINKLGPSDSDL